MERFLRLGNLGGGLGMGGTTAPADSNQVDTSETVYISSLALLKMLKHGRAGVPMEVSFSFMNLMIIQILHCHHFSVVFDDYFIKLFFFPGYGFNAW
jgi:hypothetical protein